jgi:hypothetical protein
MRTGTDIVERRLPYWGFGPEISPFYDPLVLSSRDLILLAIVPRELVYYPLVLSS